jgi:hypothetical protein
MKIRLKAKYFGSTFSWIHATVGFAADLTGNGAFFMTRDQKENLSLIDGDLSYDTKFQKIFFSRSEIWWKDNDYKLTSDIRWKQFPENAYGFGTSTLPVAADPLLFDCAKIYVTFYKKIIPGASYYLGLGYNLDHHYNIKETSGTNKTLTDFELYRGNPKMGWSRPPVYPPGEPFLKLIESNLLRPSPFNIRKRPGIMAIHAYLPSVINYSADAVLLLVFLHG